MWAMARSTGGLAPLASFARPAVVAVARVFRRGDFPSQWQPNPRPGRAGTSYNFGSARPTKNAVSYGMSTEPARVSSYPGQSESHDRAHGPADFLPDFHSI